MAKKKRFQNREEEPKKVRLYIDETSDAFINLMDFGFSYDEKSNCIFIMQDYFDYFIEDMFQTHVSDNTVKKFNFNHWGKKVDGVFVFSDERIFNEDTVAFLSNDLDLDIVLEIYQQLIDFEDYGFYKEDVTDIQNYQITVIENKNEDWLKRLERAGLVDKHFVYDELADILMITQEYFLAMKQQQDFINFKTRIKDIQFCCDGKYVNSVLIVSEKGNLSIPGYISRWDLIDFYNDNFGVK